MSSDDAPIGGRIWQDDQQPQAEWLSPSTRVPGWVKGLWTLLALALVVGVVTLAGGFDEATARRIHVAPGTVIETAHYSLTLERAFVSENSNGSWRIMLHGTCQLTGDESSQTSRYDIENLISVKDPSSGAYLDDGVHLSFDAVGDRADLTPHQPPTPCVVNGTMEEGYVPHEHVLVFVSQGRYADVSRLGTGDFQWVATPSGWTMDIPVEVIPEP